MCFSPKPLQGLVLNNNLCCAPQFFFTICRRGTSKTRQLSGFNIGSRTHLHNAEPQFSIFHPVITNTSKANHTEAACQGRRHEVFFFLGGGDGFIGTLTHLPPKLSFSSDFGHFILKMVENAKFPQCEEKKMLKYHHFWGKSPSDFSTAGDASPVPPLSTPMLPVAWQAQLCLAFLAVTHSAEATMPWGAARARRPLGRGWGRTGGGRGGDCWVRPSLLVEARSNCCGTEACFDPGSWLRPRPRTLLIG